MKLMFCMLINMKVFYKLIVLFLMGWSRHPQSTRVNAQYLCDILRKKSGMKLGTYLHWLIQILLLQFSIHPLLPPLTPFQYGIHTKPSLHLINCFCKISLLLLFQVAVGPCKLACFT